MADPFPPLRVDRLAWDRRHAPLSFSLHAGERLYVSGDQAAKLLLAIAGFIRPVSGRVECEGRDMTDTPVPARHIAIIPGGDSLVPRRTLAANIALSARTAQGAAKAAHLIDRFALPATITPDRASPAQRRLAALARALAAEPALLLVDDSAHDPPAIPEALADLNRPAAIVATQANAVALAFAHRIVLMDPGGVAQIGTPRDLYDRPANRFAATWSGACNLIPAMLDGLRSSDALTVRVGDAVQAARFRELPPGPVLLAIRPHRSRIAAAGLAARVRGIDYRGATTTLRLIAEDGTAIEIETADPPALSPGEVVHITWDAADAWPLPA